MNREIYNPHLDHHTRIHKPPQLNFEDKENDAFSDQRRDGYKLNSPDAKWGNKSGRTYFAELSYMVQK